MDLERATYRTGALITVRDDRVRRLHQRDPFGTVNARLDGHLHIFTETITQAHQAVPDQQLLSTGRLLTHHGV